jgi:hypothetical protein
MRHQHPPELLQLHGLNSPPHGSLMLGGTAVACQSVCATASGGWPLPAGGQARQHCTSCCYPGPTAATCHAQTRASIQDGSAARVCAPASQGGLPAAPRPSPQLHGPSRRGCCRLTCIPAIGFRVTRLSRAHVEVCAALCCSAAGQAAPVLDPGGSERARAWLAAACRAQRHADHASGRGIMRPLHHADHGRDLTRARAAAWAPGGRL